MRPELAVLLAYAKMALDDELLASDLPEAPELERGVARLFPGGVARPARRADPDPSAAPRDRRHGVSNDLVNRAGITFVSDMRARTGRPAPRSPAPI